MHSGSIPLYRTLMIACLAGFAWLMWNSLAPVGDGRFVCPTKHLTELPCPACGTTRSMTSLLGGDFTGAVWINPMGILLAAAMTLIPFWILTDIFRRNDSFYRAYRSAEQKIRRPRWAIPITILLLMNWFWNISKGL